MFYEMINQLVIFFCGGIFIFFTVCLILISTRVMDAIMSIPCDFFMFWKRKRRREKNDNTLSEFSNHSEQIKFFEKIECKKIYAVEAENEETANSLILQYEEAYGAHYKSHERYNLTGYSEYSNNCVPFQHTMLNIIEQLLEGYHVFTYIENEPIEDVVIREFAKYCLAPFAFVPLYVRYLKAHDWHEGKYYYNGKSSLMTLTKDSNQPLLRTFYESPKNSNKDFGEIYAYKTLPEEIDDFDYGTANKFICSTVPDIHLIGLGNSSRLDISVINDNACKERQFIERFRAICENLGKSLYVNL